MLDPIVEYLRLIIKISIVLGLILDIACYKYRYLANVILYYEGI